MATTMLHTRVATNFDTKKLVERLRVEKKKLEGQVKEQGFKLGVKCAAYLSRQEFQRLECLNRPPVRIDAEAFAEMWPILAARQAHNEIKFENGELSNLVPLNDDKRAIFVQGWIEGALSVWDQLNAK